MILDISPHNCSEPDFFDFPPRVVVGARALKSSNGYTALRIWPIELKLGKILLDTSTDDVHIEGERVPPVWTKCGQG